MLPISDALAETDTITIQDTDAAPAAPAPVESNWMSSLVPMVLIFVVFYFFLIRPQEKRRKEQEQMIGGVKKGEEVLTNSGMFGVVRKINDSDNTVHIEVAKDVEIKIMKNSIVDIVSRHKDAKQEKGLKVDKEGKWPAKKGKSHS